jgi:hypothetical protein
MPLRKWLLPSTKHMECNTFKLPVTLPPDSCNCHRKWKCYCVWKYYLMWMSLLYLTELSTKQQNIWLIVHLASLHGNLIAREQHLIVQGKRTVLSVEPCTPSIQSENEPRTLKLSHLFCINLPVPSAGKATERHCLSSALYKRNQTPGPFDLNHSFNSVREWTTDRQTLSPSTTHRFWVNIGIKALIFWPELLILFYQTIINSRCPQIPLPSDPIAVTLPSPQTPLPSDPLAHTSPPCSRPTCSECWKGHGATLPVLGVVQGADHYWRPGLSPTPTPRHHVDDVTARQSPATRHGHAITIGLSWTAKQWQLTVAYLGVRRELMFTDDIQFEPWSLSCHSDQAVLGNIQW